MNHKKILIVDDDPSFITLTKLTLEKRGDYIVEAVMDSSKALAAAKEFAPDLILLDIIMPGKDGGDVLISLQQDPALSEIPVLFLTALVSENDVSPNAAVVSGDQLMLPKTVDFEVMHSLIEELTARNSRIIAA